MAARTTAKTETAGQIGALCRILKLSKQLADTCLSDGTTSQLEFVRRLLADEVSLRDMNRVNRLLKAAGFPSLKTFENYDTTRITFPDDTSLAWIADGEFIEEKTNLVLYGPVGTGKTHMAIAAGVTACRRGTRVRFFTVASLVRQLSNARQNGKLDRLMTELEKTDLLILDEWGYVPIDVEGGRLLYQVIADSYERKSIIITTNLEFSQWGVVLGDQQMAKATIDRLIHHGQLLSFTGQSYRLEHALMQRAVAGEQSN